MCALITNDALEHHCSPAHFPGISVTCRVLETSLILCMVSLGQLCLSNKKKKRGLSLNCPEVMHEMTENFLS